MLWTSFDTWIVVLGALSAMACALLGNFLVLRRMSMMGDAISHAVLPGLAVAFLVTDSRASLPMFVGAVIVGIITALLVQFLSRFGKVDEGASMGVVFTTLFALGLILIRRAADQVDLDVNCVLYGDLNYAAAAMVRIGPFRVPEAAVILGIVLTINLLFVVLFFKELRISSFDPELATTQGFNAGALHYVLMTLVAVTAVASFDVIGNILVVAMMVAPAAAAHLLTDRLGSMVVVSLIIAAISAAIGHVGATIVPQYLGFSGTSSAGAMAAATGLIFIAAVLFGPRRGVTSRMWHRLQLSLRIAQEDLLSGLYRQEERGVAKVPASGAPSLTQWLVRRRLLQQEAIERVDGHFALTPRGRKVASRLLRSHRLWETYLVDQAALRADQTHKTAEQLEHLTDAALQQRLALDIATPTHDPQGKMIPPE
ncbi:MAG: metal ABC transporter permease [Phycisphaerales bacterium]|nr:metal ABC transporter permease [Phycisphaerales bacterium]